jgi:hypothetical protein
MPAGGPSWADEAELEIADPALLRALPAAGREVSGGSGDARRGGLKQCQDTQHGSVRPRSLTLQPLGRVSPPSL